MMPKCTKCHYEGPYSIYPGQKATWSSLGEEETTLEYMRCQAPGGGPTQNPISLIESLIDQPCDFFQPKEKPKPQKGFFSFLSKLFGGKRHSGVKFKETTVLEGRSLFEVYVAGTKDEALEFLRSKSVTEKLYYIVVETPEGNWGLDIDGIYQDK